MIATGQRMTEALDVASLDEDSRAEAPRLVGLALYLGGGEEAACTRIIRDTEQLLRCLSLSDRRCFRDSQPLPLIPHQQQPSTATSATSTTALPSMIRLVDQTAATLAAKLSERRHYMRHLHNTTDFAVRFDPRYLVFEYITSYILRKRQVSGTDMLR